MIERAHGRQNILVFDSKDKISDFLIKKWREISREAIEKGGYIAVALSGGKTPINFYRKLANSKEILPWDETHIFLVDERFVPFDDNDSNYGMLKETLLKRIQIPQENIHPVPTERSTLEMSAKEYEEELRRFFKLPQGKFPEFDLILLGIGEDGHTASLFPGSPLLKDMIHLAVSVISDGTRHHRITLTLPVINNAKHVVFLVTGGKKAAILKDVIVKRNPSLPASMVNPIGGNLMFLIDREASSALSK
jgi:6-phosphogluconolactonase